MLHKITDELDNRFAIPFDIYSKVQKMWMEKIM